MIPLTKQGAPIMRMFANVKRGLNGTAIADLVEDGTAAAKKALNGTPAAGPTTATTGSKGGRFNWVKPFATAVAVNTAAGGLPVYQTAQSLRKFLAGKGANFTKNRIGYLENAIESAKDYEKAPLARELTRYQSLNDLAQRHYNKHSYAGIWAPAILAVPAAYAAHKGLDWLNWAALNDDQRNVLTAQGKYPTTFGQDVNNLLSRAVSYYNGFKQLPEVYGEAKKRNAMLKNINNNRPFAYADEANELIRRQKLYGSAYPMSNGFNSGYQNLYVNNSHQAPAYPTVETNDDVSMLEPRLQRPADQEGQIPTHSTGIAMRH